MKAQSEGWMTTRKDRLYYDSYMFGLSSIYALVTAFLSTYLPMRGLSATSVASVMLIVKVWDAVNDVFFGGIFDKIKLSQGKFLPWLKISLPFVPLATVLLFAMPNFGGSNAKLLWFAITYIFWDAAYTLCDVPLYGLVTTMTNHLQERTSIMSFAKLYNLGGLVFAYAMATLLVSQQVGFSYTTAALICGLIALATMTPICLKGKEHNYQDTHTEETFTFREMFRYMRQNKYLLIFYAAFIINGCLGVATGLGMFVSYYLFDNELFNLILGAIAMVPTVLLVAIIPQLIKKVDKFKLYYGGWILSTLIGILIYAVGYQNRTLFIVLSVLRAIPAAFPAFLVFMFTPDCAEYGQYKSGTEAKGITFAIQTFSAKLTASISTSLGLALIGMFGFVSYEAANFAELSEMGVAQTPEALHGLWITYALVPVIGGILQVLLLWFYKLNDKDVQIMSDCNSGLITREEAEAALSRKY